jgi:hypothetical protein
MTGDVWQVRSLPDGLALELRGRGDPAPVLTPRKNRVRVELARVKALAAALAGTEAHLAELQAGGGVYHA